VYLYFKDKQILKIVKKLMFFFFFFFLNVKCWMFLKNRMRVPLLIAPYLFFYWKYAPFLHILNDNMYMMLSVCCFWIFNKKKRYGESWVNFFLINFFPPPYITYAWIWIPYGFIKAVNFKIFFFNIMDGIKYDKFSCSWLWILSRKHIQTDPSSSVLFSVGATWTFNKYNNIEK
jgi:hypothetical protein